MVTWQFWTLIGVILVGYAGFSSALADLIKATHFTNQLLIEMKDEIRGIHGIAGILHERNL